MPNRFREALLWHMERHGTKVAALARDAGVTEDVIKKLRSISTASTNAEAALRIANSYGKTLDAFMACGPAGDDAEFLRLAARLSDQERQMVLAMIQGLLAARDRQLDREET